MSVALHFLSCALFKHQRCLLTPPVSVSEQKRRFRFNHSPYMRPSFTIPDVHPRYFDNLYLLAYLLKGPVCHVASRYLIKNVFPMPNGAMPLEYSTDTIVMYEACSLRCVNSYSHSTALRHSVRLSHFRCVKPKAQCC